MMPCQILPLSIQLDSKSVNPERLDIVDKMSYDHPLPWQGEFEGMVGVR
jgi:hypothetical protein